MMEHIAVLSKETVEHLKVKKGGVYLDLTVGGGGHSLEILRLLEGGSDGHLIVFDLDQEALEQFQSKVDALKCSTKVTLINANYDTLGQQLDELGIDYVDGIVADLGWSSDELASLPGLSYERASEELDMRFDQTLGVKAKDLLNALSPKEMQKMLSNYADIFGQQNAKLVSTIIARRKQKLFENVEDLTLAIDQALGLSSQDRKHIRFSNYARVFQALRIAVNQEFDALQKMLQDGFSRLQRDGNFLVITFHSGEEKLVRSYLDKLVDDEQAAYCTRQQGNNYIRPGVDELVQNLKARSAKLYGITKL